MLFIVDVNFGETLADIRERPEVRSERNAGQFAFQVCGVTLAIERMMQHGIDVMENVPLRDRLVFVMGTKLFERPITITILGYSNNRIPAQPTSF